MKSLSGNELYFETVSDSIQEAYVDLVRVLLEVGIPE